MTHTSAHPRPLSPQPTGPASDDLVLAPTRAREGSKWKVVAAFLAVFVLGGATGAAIGHVVEVRRTIDMFDAARKGSRHGTFVWSLERKLGLTSEQRTNIESILKGYDARMDEAMAPVDENVREIRRTMRAEVRATLRPEQQIDFDQLVADWDNARGRK